MKKVFIYRPLSIMEEGEKGFVPSHAVVILYQDGKYGYCINLLANYSPKKDYNTPIQVFKLNGKYLVEDFISANLVYYPQMQLPEGWIEYTEFIELVPVFYQSADYVSEASFELLNNEFSQLLQDPEQIVKDQSYFKLLLQGLLSEDKVLLYYEQRTLLDIILVYYHLQLYIESIDNEVKDFWTVDERMVYEAWIKILYSHIDSRINSEWKTLSTERQQEFFEKFKDSESFEWISKIPKSI
jgi:hypothetical protein